jgi:hypothetical protein
MIERPRAPAPNGADDMFTADIAMDTVVQRVER